MNLIKTDKNYPDPFDEEAESIISVLEAAGHTIPPSKRSGLIGELALMLEDAWNACRDRVLDVAHEAKP